MNPRRRNSPYMHLWPELAYMPVLSHWPDRTKPFSPEQSEVLAWIADAYRCDLAEAERIFRSAQHQRVVRFNRETRLWCGTKGDQP